MLVINGTSFYPQQRSGSASNNSSEERSMNNTHSKKRRTSIDLDALDNCRTLGDCIHEPELFLEKEHSHDFMCVICQCICNTPYDIGCKNGHIYCKTCLNAFFESNSHGKCPQCADNVNRYGTRINHFALRLLLKLRIFCPFSMEQCIDEKQSDMYKCEWIGCYSDIIDHLKHKCKYGTFINNATIQQTRDKYKTNQKLSTTNNKSNTTNSIWQISRAEITSYKVFWEQICDKDQHLGNHVNKKTVSQFFADKLRLTRTDLVKLWWIVGDSGDALVSENQFYAGIHIARLHQNEYKEKCSLHSLYSLPACLSCLNINKIRYDIHMSIGSTDLKKVQESLEQSAEQKYNDKKKEISLDTHIGTMSQLKEIAGIHKTTVHKKRKSSVNNAVNWNISKEDIDGYKKWFIKADLNADGYISGEEGRKFFVKSKLSPADLGKIWMQVDREKSGKLTEAQFYAFFHIVMNVKKGGKLTKNFVLPFCLQQANILNLMSGNDGNHVNGDWNLLMNGNVNHHTSASTNALPSINILRLSNTADPQRRARANSIDSVPDWADFSFEF